MFLPSYFILSFSFYFIIKYFSAFYFFFIFLDFNSLLYFTLFPYYIYFFSFTKLILLNEGQINDDNARSFIAPENIVQYVGHWNAIFG